MTAAYVALQLESVDDARAFADRAVPIARGLDNPFVWMILQGNVALAALFSNDIGSADKAFREELSLGREIVAPLTASEGLLGLAAVSVTRDDLERAAHLVGAAATHADDQYATDAVERRLHATYFEPARKRHGDGAWAAARSEGATLSLQDAIAYALENGNLRVTGETPSRRVRAIRSRRAGRDCAVGHGGSRCR